MACLNEQTRLPDEVVICLVDPADAPSAAAQAGACFPVKVVTSERKGSCAQRNAGLERMRPDADSVVFLDDDFAPATDYFEQLEGLFATRPEAVGFTGVVVRDGATGPGFTFEEAHAAIRAHADDFAVRSTDEAVTSLYGCNMAFRTEAVVGLRFDERLPLYGWLEDVDYSVQAGWNGALIRSGALLGAHLGAKRGKTSGVRFGYSQIVNPVYLLRKKTISPKQALANIARTAIANHLKTVAPEPYVDRWGRVRGNWLAIADILRGRIRPERILEL